MFQKSKDEVKRGSKEQPFEAVSEDMNEREILLVLAQFG